MQNWNFWSLASSEFVHLCKFLRVAVFLHRTHISEMFVFWNMGQNTHSIQLQQFWISHVISPEHIEEIAWFFACWNKLKMFWVGMGRNRCDHSSKGTLKIDCISIMSWCIKLVFCMLIQIQESCKLFQWFWGGCDQEWIQPFIYEILTCCTSRMNLWIELIFCMLISMKSFG